MPSMAGPRQVCALEELHGDVGQIVFLASIKDRHDAGVLQAPRCFCLAKEPGSGVDECVALELFAEREGLDGNHASNLWVSSQVDHAHCPFANLPVYLIAAQHRYAGCGITWQARRWGGGNRCGCAGRGASFLLQVRPHTLVPCMGILVSLVVL